ncbi:MAG: hypothetical protein QOH10_1617 [Actinomycetota bacterium]|nr:hypothetical protein [Actinomycetota bacterium]
MRARVTAAAATIVAAALVAGAYLLVATQRRALTHDVESAARIRAEDLANSLADGTLPAQLTVPADDSAFIQVVDTRSHRIVAASSNVKGEPLLSNLVPVPGRPSVATIANLPVGEGAFRLVARDVRAGVGHYIVYAAAGLGRVDQSTAALTRSLLFGLPWLIAFVTAITWLVLDRALRPVESIRVQVAAIGEHELHRRVPEPRRADEIGRLARTMNAMLDRIDDAHDRQRRFVADASHELRSPLTAIRTQLEVDLAHPTQVGWHHTETDVLDETIRMQRLVDDLLALARADRRVLVREHEPVDLDDIVLREARRLRGRGRIRVDTSLVAAGPVSGDHDALARAVRNLGDNAERHAHTTVSFVVREADDHVELVVGDDGDGIPAHERERIFERFTRLGDSRERVSGGTGLGLAIAREIVQAHGGSLRLDATDANDHSGGGATFMIVLPLRS